MAVLYGFDQAKCWAEEGFDETKDWRVLELLTLLCDEQGDHEVSDIYKELLDGID